MEEVWINGSHEHETRVCYNSLTVILLKEKWLEWGEFTISDKNWSWINNASQPFADVIDVADVVDVDVINLDLSMRLHPPGECTDVWTNRRDGHALSTPRAGKQYFKCDNYFSESRYVMLVYSVKEFNLFTVLYLKHFYHDLRFFLLELTFNTWIWASAG